jgi:2-phosphosulfolactate phosphatase
MALSVFLEWGEMGARVLSARCGVLIIVDVLSFTTAVDVAVSRGASVLPYPRYDDTAAEFAMRHGALLASNRRRGTTEQPFTLSPATMLAIPSGSRLVLPSPNGSAISAAASATAHLVMAGCLRNAAAVAASVTADSVGVIPAGERWPDHSMRVAFEDLVGAGAIIAHLPSDGWSPEARAAAAAFQDARPDLEQQVFACPSGRELTDIGFAEDVRLAADLNVSSSVPRLVEGVYLAA